MENLDKALASLAEQLGVHSEEFIFWLTNGGLESYARMQLIDYGVMALSSLVVAVLCIKLCLWCFKMREHGDDDDLDYLGSIVLFAATFGVVACAFFVCMFSDFLCWWLTPEGALVELILNRL